MKELKKIKIFCLVGVLFVSIFGAISHFFYDWSGKNEIVGTLFFLAYLPWFIKDIKTKKH